MVPVRSEIDFLCSLLSEGAASTAAQEVVPPEDWDSALRAASAEVVLPSLHAALVKRGGASRIPPEVAGFLKSVEDLNRERNEFILDETLHIIGHLNAGGIQPILLKGAAYLATGVFCNPGERFLGDIDLLVPEGQVAEAVEILQGHGFEPDYSDTFCLYRHHHFPLRRPGSVFIEIHHSLGLGPCNSVLSPKEVIDSAIPCNFGGIEAKIPSPEHLMVHLIMHSQMQHPYSERVWTPVRAMYDLVLLQRRFGEAIDWASIEGRFRKARQLGLLVLHILRVNEALGASIHLSPRVTALTRFRWQRRQLLRRIPALRYADPTYMFSEMLLRRLRVLRNMLKKAGGISDLFRQIFTWRLYQRLAIDVITGRGK